MYGIFSLDCYNCDIWSRRNSYVHFLYTKKPQPRGTVSYSKKVEDLGIYDFSCSVLSKLLLLPAPYQITERK